ncbi:MAG: DUF898 domain-containing protein [Cytophagaceae bacterium]|nr:DUF898 domain-containing protein [Cytophagaceae bacterium]
MSDLNKTQRSLTFYGEGSKLFGITIINAILTVVTVGFYYPWAKVAKLHYLYSEFEFEGSRFEFHGKGKEVFKGFLKLIAFIVIFYGVLIGLPLITQNVAVIIISVLAVYTLMIFIIPLALHGSARYRLSRTSWRGIHFGYRGDRKELVTLFVKGFLLTLVTFGIYASWLSISLRKYIIGNIRFGNITFSYKGDGGEFLWLNFTNYFLSIITLGIYFPWYMKNLTNYYIENITLHQDGKKIKLKSSITGGGYFVLFLGNALIVLFTLGFGTAWATIRTLRYFASNVTVVGDLDTESIQQTEEDYKNATGDDLADFFEIDLI